MSALRFNEGLAVDVLNDSHVFILSDVEHVLIDSVPAAAVAEAVNGERDLVQVVGEAARKVGVGEAFAAARSMMRRRYLVDTAPTNSPWAAYLESRGLPYSKIMNKLAAAPVALVPAVLSRTDDEVDFVANQAQDALARAGISAVVVSDASRIPEGHLPMVLAEDYIHPVCDLMNTWALRTGRTWVLAKPWGQSAWVGPAFQPKGGPCWSCLRERLVANRQSERYLAERLNRLPAVKAAGLMPGAVDMVVAAVVSHCVALAADEEAPLRGIIRTIDLAAMDFTGHMVSALPTCSACGSVRFLSTDLVQIEPAQAENQADGGYRVCSPEETVGRLEQHISPIVGAVSKLESLGVDTDGVTFSFAAGHNFAVVSDSLRMLKQNMRGQSGGKGRTKQQAKASAVCEAIERFCGVWTPAVPAVRSSFEELNERAVHPEQVLLFSDAQYLSREKLDFEDTKFHRVPERFDESLPIDFTPARSLTTGERVLIPAGLAWYGVPDLITGPQYAYTDSNGQAAGNTVEEAVLQGMCKVVERDAVGMWWFNRLQRPGIDLDSFEDPYIDVLRTFYRERGRNLWALDLTNDLGMPVFAALSRRECDVQDIMLGFGAHSDPVVALFRALTELNQFLPFVAHRNEQGQTIYGTDDGATIEWCRNVTVDSDPWLLPHPEFEYRHVRSFEQPSTRRLDHLVQRQVEKFASVNIETIIINQTRPEIDLAVVKVLAPGLRHFWRRTAPGRLYDIPVSLGWMAAANTEENLNPRSVFF